MCLEDTVRIPLRRRDGSIRAYAIVDADDAEWVNQWRWCLAPIGYVVRNDWTGGTHRTLYLHRELLGLTPGDGLEVDHVNRIRTDNRRSNLRTISRAGNAQNLSAIAGTSGYRGVYLHQPGIWRASMWIAGKRVYLGLFNSELEAAEVVREARRRLMPYSVD